MDLVVVDVGPPAIAKALLNQETFKAYEQFLSVEEHDEPLLLLANGRHGLVSEDFVRNTSPDLIFAHQDGLPIALRDADIEIGLKDGLTDFEHKLLLRTDRRLGFHPTKPFELSIRVVRSHGAFMPELGVRDFKLTHQTPERFFELAAKREARPHLA